MNLYVILVGVIKMQEQTNYPRPQLRRDQYTTLDGYWDYGFSINKEIDDYDGKILVPYPPESQKSGVERILLPGNYLHYRRTFHLTKHAHQRLLLHFEAVDAYCEVFLNGCFVGKHDGGYLPFSFDITNGIVEGENEIKVVVQDDTDYGNHARGKQRLHHGGMYYTPVSGIWQTVWYEWVDEQHITDVLFKPDLQKQGVYLEVCTVGDLEDVEVIIHQPDTKESTTYHIPACQQAFIALKNIQLWSPDHPCLYDVELIYGHDHVTSYFGMRAFSQVEINGHHYMAINGKPIFHYGLLDQGYYQRTLMSPPSDEAVIKDLKLVKSLGFNTIRKHVKIENSRFYYHCDQLGILVMQDMVNGGERYDDQFVTVQPNLFPALQSKHDDHNYIQMKRPDPDNRAAYYREVKETIEHLRHFVSIDTWVAFNEGWGQFDSQEVTDYIKKLDPERFVDSASGWFDMKAGDFLSIHNYFRPLHLKKSQRIIILSEFGGMNYQIKNHFYGKKNYGYKRVSSRKDIMMAYRKLMIRDIMKNIPHGLAGSIYTQLSDIEDEVNGLITYDREVVKCDQEIMRGIAQRIYGLFDREVGNE